jgi:hypothetical protein
MALLFMDGFGGGECGSKWGFGSQTSYTPQTASPRSAGGYYLTAGSAVTPTSLIKNLPAASTMIVGFGIRFFDTFQASWSFSFYGDGGGTQHITVVYNTGTGQLNIRRGSSSGTLLVSTVSQLLFNQWNYVEISVSISDTVGEIHVRLNGSPTDDVSFVGDTKNGGTATTIDKVAFGMAKFDIADVYIADTTGTAANTFLGDVAVRTLTPNGNGTYSQLVGSDSDSVNNYLLVDDRPYSGADYVASANTGDKDSYTMADLPAGVTTIYGMQIGGLIAKSDVSLAQARYFVRSGGTDYGGTTQTLNTSFNGYYDLRTVDPATGLAWTPSGINSAEVGLEIM